MKPFFFICSLILFGGWTAHAQSEELDDIQNQMFQIQEEMMRLFQELQMAPREDGSFQFDTTFTYQYSYPMTPFGEGLDSLDNGQMDMQMRMFSPLGTFPLEEMMKELEQMDAQEWSQIEEMMRQFQMPIPLMPFGPLQPQEDGSEPGKKKKKRKITRI